MKKIPKKIVNKIEKRNKLNKEIETWCKENLNMDGMCSDCADITDHHTGNEQRSNGCREWCDNGLDAAKMIITVIITGKQSIRENICTWNFGCKSWR